MTKRDLIAALTDYEDDFEVLVSVEIDHTSNEPTECSIDNVTAGQHGLCYLIVSPVEWVVY